MLENIVVDVDDYCADATEELAVVSVVERLLSYFELIYLPNMWFKLLVNPHVIKKVKQCGWGLQWYEPMTHMVLELVLHRTPPRCIATNIFTVAKILCPHTKIVKELPSISFVKGFRSALYFFTKLLVSYQLGKAYKFLEHHSNGTQCRHISLQNCIIRISTDGGFNTVTLSYAILS